MVALSEEKKLKISELFLVALSLFPILRPALQSILIIVFCLISILFYYKNFWKRLKSRKVVLIFVLLTGYYIWYIMSSLWSEEIVKSFADAQSNIVLLLFPIIFIFFHPPLSKNIVARVQLIFVLAMLIYLIFWYDSYIVGVSHYQILKLKELSIFDYSFLEQLDYFVNKGFYWISGSSIRGYRLANEEMKLFVHHNYVASYFVLAFYAVLNRIYYAKKLVWKFLMIIPAVLFVGIIFYLPSKMNQLVLLASIPVLAYYFFGKKIAIVLVLFGFLASGIFLFKNQEKVLSMKFIEKENLISKDSSIIDFYRYHVYQCMSDKILNNVLFGMGKGDVQPFLNSCLPSDEWPGLSVEKREYNTHSQLLGYLAAGGIIGIISFLGLWVKLFSLAFNRRRAMFMILLLVIFANTIFENYLTRVWGSFIFVFFTFIYLQNDFHSLNLNEGEEN